MKHVFTDYTELIRCWMEQKQDEGHTPVTEFRSGQRGSRMFFEGPTIYSYRHSWPLATFHAALDGSPFVLVNDERYEGHVTNQQCAEVQRCLMGRLPFATVESVDGITLAESARTRLGEQISTSYNALLKKRKVWHVEQHERTVDNANKAARAFGWPEWTHAPSSEEWERLKLQIAEREDKDAHKPARPRTGFGMTWEERRRLKNADKKLAGLIEEGELPIEVAQCRQWDRIKIAESAFPVAAYTALVESDPKYKGFLRGATLTYA